ncbi:ribonucleotide reductase inhibitor-domain-containing protein [Phaeosphaeria sp. MPI-PUGE-AT-0046c]|nr:ribonucleotide reductase inhibitor-domain-containing protein [Phaeosphaeria sp. MPI-PUGE-AT-0046c]
MHTTERHRTKRPFQPAITSYFPRDDDDFEFDSEDDDLRGLNPHTRPRPQHHPRAAQHSHKETLAPQVPGHVQSDLLQVGMRVRKSVPEGYKTHNNKMMALPSIQTTLSHKPSSTSSTTTMTLDLKPPRGPVPTEVIHQRELLPFCGLHKIGGYAEQPTTNIHLYTDSNTATINTNSSSSLPPPNHFPFQAETFSQPFHTSSSQDSGYESPAPLHPGKRAWHDEDEIRLDMSGSSAFFFGKGNARNVDDVPVSPLSETPEDMLPAVRRFKQPKSRRQKEIGGGREDAEEAARLVVGSASDFEEADFLGGDIDMISLTLSSKSLAYRGSVDSVPVAVHVGDEPRTFYVHETLLCSNSMFFTKALEKEWEEGETRQVDLPDCRPDTFRIWVKWMYTGRLCYAPTERDDGGQWFARDFFDWKHVYELGDFLQDSDLKDAAIDAHVEGMIETNQYALFVPYWIYPYSTAASAHRKLAVDLCIEVWNREDFALNQEYFPPDFLHDIMASIVPRLSEGIVGKTIRKFFRGADWCTYHDHGPDQPCYRTRPTCTL